MNSKDFKKLLLKNPRIKKAFDDAEKDETYQLGRELKELRIKHEWTQKEFKELLDKYNLMTKDIPPFIPDELGTVFIFNDKIMKDMYETSTKAVNREKKLDTRSEEHTSELQSHSFISYAVFCLKKKKKKH